MQTKQAATISTTLKVKRKIEKKEKNESKSQGKLVGKQENINQAAALAILYLEYFNMATAGRKYDNLSTI